MNADNVGHVAIGPSTSQLLANLATSMTPLISTTDQIIVHEVCGCLWMYVILQWSFIARLCSCCYHCVVVLQDSQACYQCVCMLYVPICVHAVRTDMYAHCTHQHMPTHHHASPPPPPSCTPTIIQPPHTTTPTPGMSRSKRRSLDPPCRQHRGPPHMVACRPPHSHILPAHPGDPPQT